MFVGEILRLVHGNAFGGLLGNIVRSFVGKNIGNKSVGLLLGCAVGDKIVANEMIRNIGVTRVGVSVGAVVGNCVGEIAGL
jgi:F0F1-type ATP synthase beta subunit